MANFGQHVGLEASEFPKEVLAMDSLPWVR